MIKAQKNFKNSVMIVYDINKSKYGLNPLKCYRLSEGVISALNIDIKKENFGILVQDKIRENNLNIQNFFDEVPLVIKRSHLLQAFLFDHIQPHMPAFNTNLFNLGSSTQHLTQHLYLASEHTQSVIDELAKNENQHKY